MALFVKYTVMGSVVFLMLGVGLRTNFQDVIGVAKQFRLVMRGLLANFVVVPVLIYVAILWLPISSDVKIGIMLMARAGFDPQESINLWQNMAEQGGDRPPELLSTHPSPASRINELNRLLSPAEAIWASANARGIVPDCRAPV